MRTDAEKMQRMEEALNHFIKQWEACGPNSDFGRYFKRVYRNAKDAVK